MDGYIAPGEMISNTGWLRAAAMNSAKGASGGTEKVCRRTKPTQRRCEPRAQHLCEHGSGDVWRQFDNRNGAAAATAGEHALAGRAQIANPVGALLAVGGDQKAAGRRA